MINWTHIITHHSLTKDSETKSWDAIRRYHKDTLGWSDIGYHFGIEQIGNSWHTLRGRSLNRTGAHTKGMNSKAIGICVVGNYDVVEPAVWAMQELYQLHKALVIAFDIQIANIGRHSDYSSKSCPGKLFDLEPIKRMLEADKPIMR